MRTTLCFSLLLCTAIGQAADWRQHQDPRGFTISLPPGWQAAGNRDIIVLEGAGRTSFAVVQPFFIRQRTTAAQWVLSVPQTLGDLFPGARVVRSAQRQRQPDEVLAGLAFEHQGQPAKAALLCSILGRSGMFYAIAAPDSQWASERRLMIQMMRSFRFTGAPAPGRPAEQLRYVRFTEPRENAWSVEVPQGWKTQGGVVRKGPGDTRHILNTTAPDNSVQFFSDDVDLKLMYQVPNQVTQMSGYSEGRMYNAGTMMLRFHTGAQYLQMYLPRRFGGFCGEVRLTEIRDRSDISNRMNSLHASTLGRVMQYHFGDAVFECGGRRGYYLAATLSSNPGTGLITWTVPVLGGFLANPDRFETGMEAMGHMQRTWATNPQWFGRESGAAMRRAEMARQANAEISDMIMQSYRNRQGRMDEVARKRSNATLNYTDVVDPETGETWKVESGHNYYWRRGNEVAGTNTYQRPDIDFTPLEQF